MVGGAGKERGEEGREEARGENRIARRPESVEECSLFELDAEAEQK